MSTAPSLSTPPFTFRAATWADVPELGRLYAAAFADNPAYDEIFELSGQQKHAALCWLFEKRVQVLLYSHLPVLIAQSNANNNTQIVGACAIIPKKQKPSTWALLRNGILLWPLKWGFSSLRRALTWEGKIGSVGDAEIVMVSVKPEFHGRGIGSQIVRKMLADVRDQLGDISLNTQSERNVVFYSRLGFETVSKKEMGGNADGHGYFNWTMILPKGAAATEQ